MDRFFWQHFAVAFVPSFLVARIDPALGFTMAATISVLGIHREISNDWAQHLTELGARFRYSVNPRNWTLDPDDRWQAWAYPIGGLAGVALAGMLG